MASLPPRGEHSDVRLVTAPARTFEEETAILLRTRLRAYSLVSLISLNFFLIQSLWIDHLLLGFRALIVLLLATCCALVQWSKRLTPFGLRALEVLILLGMVCYLTTMMIARLLDFADRGDAISLSAVEQGYMGGWVFLILTYGMFIPMRWQWAAALLLPVGFLPGIALAVLAWIRGDVAGIFEKEQFLGFTTLPPAASAVAIYAAASIYRIRQVAFEGRKFGQYVLHEQIGKGGMGEVYRAEHLLLKRACALKLIRLERSLDEATIMRFEAEVRATARLSHPNTIEIYDFGRAHDGTLYYVMELLRGLSLDELVERFGPLPPPRVVYLLRQVCGALGEAHAAGMVHRDVKPSNIFAAKRGGVCDFVKLLDFGLVRHTEGHTVADEGKLGGSPQYMAPEQFADYAKADARSDLYAVGAVGYFLLMGRPPFGGRRIKDLREAHARQPVIRPSVLGYNTSTDLEEILLRCLAKRPEDRFASAAELQESLEACSCAASWNEHVAQLWWLKHGSESAANRRNDVETVI